MNDRIRIGDFTVTVLTDGDSHLPPSAYPGADFSAFPEQLDETGTVRGRLGAHLVQGPAGTFLIDAGAGELSMPFPAEMAAADSLTNPPTHMASAGRLPAALAAAGVTPEEITKVFITHLHLDHIGWLIRDDEPYFPNADVYYGDEDWDLFVERVDEDDPVRTLMLKAQRAGILRPYRSEATELLPGVIATHLPGHTPGHHMITLRSNGEELWFVGDLLELPAQVTDDAIRFMTDIDADQARADRVRLMERARGTGVVIAAAHLTNPSFGRVSDDGAWVDATSA